MKIIFNNSRKTWRITWIIGSIFTSLSLLFNYHFWFFYYYFFFIGFISYIYSLFKYAYVNGSELIIFYGNIYNRKRIKILWSELNSVLKSTYMKNNIRTVGGRVRFTINEETESEIIELEFKNVIQPNIVKDIKKYGRDIKVVDEGNKIILLTPPEGGFERLLKAMNIYISNTTFNNSFVERINSLLIINTIIMLCSFSLIIANIMKYWCVFTK